MNKVQIFTKYVVKSMKNYFYCRLTHNFFVTLHALNIYNNVYAH